MTFLVTCAIKPRNYVLGAALAAMLGSLPVAHAAVTLKIKNFSGQPVWVMWTGTAGGAAGLTGTSGTTSIAPSDFGVNSAGYSLSSPTFKQVVPNEYEIKNFTMSGGRMWFTYGASSWAFTSAGYTPPFATFNDVNFPTRYDKIEASITGSVDDNLNMTALDGFSIPFTVKGYASSSPSTTTQTLNGSLGKTLYTALGAIAANTKTAAVPITPTNALPALQSITGNSPYIVINSNSQGTTPPPSPYAGYTYSPIGSSGSFVRVIGNDNIMAPYGGDPVAAANGNAVPTNYNWMSYNNYVKRMDGRATSPYTGATTIAGSFAGVKPFTTALTSPASYSLTATFSATETRTVTYPQSGGNPVIIAFTGFVTLTGTSTIASGQFAGTYNVVIKIPYGGLPEYYSVQSGNYHNSFMLDPTGVVGSNANYLYKFYLQGQPDPGFSQTDLFVGGPQNNVLTQAEGDLFAGMNVGTVGSNKTLPNNITINGNLYIAGTPVGTFNSQDWFSLGSTLLASSGSGSGSVYDYYFSCLQNSSEYYNKYAETLYPLTDAYGFAYSDRIQGGQVAISWNATGAAGTPIDTIEITILPDVGVPLLSAAVDAVEYYNDALRHYFLTWVPEEIAKLDAGTVIKGWTRTGRTIRTFSTAQAGMSAVCRYYIPPQLGNAHFFGRDAAECSSTAAKNPGFVLEAAAFMYMFLPSQGVCPANSSPVYRVFSNRADVNHRYLNDLATRNQMVAQGWLAEGDGPDRVTMCAPL